ncbi:hypothetical protein Plhal304r1_c007g0026741 [Plasmopara halstedii]
MTSDRRLKKNIQSCPIDRVKRLYDAVRDDIEGGEDPSLEPAKQQLNVDYSRISAYNMKMIQHLLALGVKPSKSKKYRVWVRLDTGKLRKVDFGARGYAQYRDQTPLRAFSHLDHNDEERRHRYYLRHKVDYPEPSADFYAKKFLW